jgi:hypothetical protein
MICVTEQELHPEEIITISLNWKLEYLRQLSVRCIEYLRSKFVLLYLMPAKN